MSKTPSSSAARRQSGGSVAAAALEMSQVDASMTAPPPEVVVLPEVKAEKTPLGESSEEDYFFAHGGNKSESLVPIASDVSFDEPVVDEARQATLVDRRAKLRKIVMGVVGVASLMAAFVAVKALVTRHTAVAPSATLDSMGPVVASIDLGEPSGAAVQPAADLVPAAQPPEQAAAPAAEPAPAEIPEVRIEVFDEPPAQPAAAPRAAGAPAAPRTSPKLDARRFLAGGKLKEAVASARTALAADPADAEPYLLLGAALQDTGHWDESVIVFASCVQNAKRGPLGDCRALSHR
jgi:colicin import membrane protein